MSGPSVDGATARRVSIRTFVLPGAARVRTPLPQTQTPFQTLWLRKIFIREEISAREKMLVVKTGLSKHAAVLLPKIETAITETTAALEKQTKDLAQAEAAASQEFSATSEVKELSSQIAELTAALDGIRDAAAVVLGALTTPGLEAADRNELEAAKIEGEEQAGELSAALTGCRDTLAAFKTVLMRPVETLRQTIEAEKPALVERERGLRETKATIERQQADRTTEIRADEATLAELREEEAAVNRDLTALSPASAAILNRTYPAETIEDLTTLRETVLLIENKLLPLLVLGTVLSTQYGEDLSLLRGKIRDLFQSLIDQKLREEEGILNAALPKVKEDFGFLCSIEHYPEHPGFGRFSLPFLHSAHETITALLHKWKAFEKAIDSPCLAGIKTSTYKIVLEKLDMMIAIKSKAVDDPVAFALCAEEELLEAVPHLETVMQNQGQGYNAYLEDSDAPYHSSEGPLPRNYSYLYQDPWVTLINSGLQVTESCIPEYERVVAAHPSHPDIAKINSRLTALREAKEKLEIAAVIIREKEIMDQANEDIFCPGKTTGMYHRAQAGRPETFRGSQLHSMLSVRSMLQLGTGLWLALRFKYPQNTIIAQKIEKRGTAMRTIGAVISSREKNIKIARDAALSEEDVLYESQHYEDLLREISAAAETSPETLGKYKKAMLVLAREILSTRLNILWPNANQKCYPDRPFDALIDQLQAAFRNLTTAISKTRA
ncbi:MAG: hypothetical protein NT099_02595 [Candidatus Saganbacteria bacterium]|nr:hypothetical protein [Candidatus Saganbacteria bacterium]